ncbi:carbohydrate porin [Desulforhopalus sp. 52FAK]
MNRYSSALVFCITALFVDIGFDTAVCAQNSQHTTDIVRPLTAEEDIWSTPFGGPSSVGGSFKKDQKAKLAIHSETPTFSPYFDFKKKIAEDYGLSFGFDYNALYQAATASLGEKTASGGVLRMFGRWLLVGKGSKNTGTLVYKVENRHKLGTEIIPQDLGSQTGYAGLTAVPFSDIGWALTNFFWDQQLLDNRLAFVGGFIDVTDYVDVYGLVDPWSDFSNLAFSTDPTIPAPNQGLAAAARVLVTDHVYLLGGIADANGDPTDPGNGFESFFDQGEYFTHLEIGWVPSIKQGFSDNVHFTVWHADERVESGVDDGWGMAVSVSSLIEDTWEPFLRAGYAEDGGALWENSLSIGTGYHIRKDKNMIGIGLNWGRPSEALFGAGANDQYTVELFYRLQLFTIVTITPDVQLLFNPAENPEEDTIAIFGLRVRLSF